MAEATRRKVYDMLVAEKMMVQGFHYPFPSLAYIEKSGDRLPRGHGAVESDDLKNSERFATSQRPPSAAAFIFAQQRGTAR